MDFIQSVLEYYDELFPVTDAQKEFYEALTGLYASPAKILRIGCGTGLLEHTLARQGNDVTGIEASKQIINSANLRRRNQLMSIRFFLMAHADSWYSISITMPKEPRVLILPMMMMNGMRK